MIGVIGSWSQPLKEVYGTARSISIKLDVSGNHSSNLRLSTLTVYLFSFRASWMMTSKLS